MSQHEFDPPQSSYSSFYYLLPNTASETLYSGFIQEAQRYVSGYLLSPDFNAAGVVEGIHQTIDAYRDSVVPDRLAVEARLRDPQKQHLQQYLGLLAIAPEAVPSQAFMDDLHTQIDNSNLDFSSLGWWRENLDQVGILPLIQEVDYLYRNATNTAAWLPNAFRLVQHAAENPQDFTLPTDRLDALYAITFLPNPARGLVRRMIVGNVITDQIHQALGGEMSASEWEMVQALQQFYIAEALEGQHWDDHLSSEDNSSTEDISITMAGYSAQRLQALATLRHLAESGQAGRIPEVWSQVTHGLQAMIEEVNATANLDLWQRQDIGHCFGGFSDWTLSDILSTAEYASQFYAERADKNGQMTVVLEDDPQQRTSIAEIVDQHTPYSVSSHLLFDTPEGIEPFLDDPSIGLFVLDIENGLDRTAGIRVAEQLFYSVLARATDIERPIHIVLWSASPSAVSAATALFEQLISQHPQGHSVSYSFRTTQKHNRSDPLQLDIRLKRWDPDADFLQRST